MSIDVLYPNEDNDIKQCTKRMKNHGSFPGPHLIIKPEIQSPNFNYTAYLSMNSAEIWEKKRKKRREKDPSAISFSSEKYPSNFMRMLTQKYYSLSPKMMHRFAASFYCSWIFIWCEWMWHRICVPRLLIIMCVCFLFLIVFCRITAFECITKKSCCQCEYHKAGIWVE